MHKSLSEKYITHTRSIFRTIEKEKKKIREKKGSQQLLRGPTYRARDTVFRAFTKRGTFPLSSRRTYGARCRSSSVYVTSVSLRFRASIRKATCICRREAGKRRKVVVAVAVVVRRGQRRMPCPFRLQSKKGARLCSRARKRTVTSRGRV